MVRWTALFLVVMVTRVGAQSAGASSAIPDAYRPPPGMCRIWIDGVPPDRQPAPTDCATAVRRRPTNAKVVFGDLSTYVAPVNSQSSAAPASGTPATTNTSHSAAPNSTAPRDSANEQRSESRPAAPAPAPTRTPAPPPDPRLAPLPTHGTPIHTAPAPAPAPTHSASPARPISPPAQKSAPAGGHPPHRAS